MKVVCIPASILKIEMVVEGTILEVKRLEPLNMSLNVMGPLSLQGDRKAGWGCREVSKLDMCYVFLLLIFEYANPKFAIYYENKKFLLCLGKKNAKITVGIRHNFGSRPLHSV